MGKLDKVQSTRTFATPTSLKKPQVEKNDEKTFQDYISLPYTLITTDSNIRTEYNEEEITGLAQSIKQYGQLEPIRVYEKNNEYVIIFGHRRFFAIKKLNEEKVPGFTEIKCIISEKPDSLDKLYLQAIENEHAVNLSSSDREKYIATLQKEYSQSPEDIARKLGKSTSWIYQVIQASKIRTKHEDAFNEAGITLTTKDTIRMARANEEQIKEALNAITENPESKTYILEELQNSTKMKKGSRTKTTPNLKKFPGMNTNELKSSFLNSPEEFEPPNLPTESPEYTIEPVIDEEKEENQDAIQTSSFKEMKVEITIGLDNDSKKINIKAKALGEHFNSHILPLIKDTLNSYYQEEGYIVENQ